MYEEHVLDHYRNPRNAGSLSQEDATITLRDTNPLCGDAITVALTLRDGIIVAARHQTNGCAISQAGASMLFEQLEGKRARDVLALQKESVLDEFGTVLSVSRVKCALLGLHAVKKALVQSERAAVEESRA